MMEKYGTYLVFQNKNTKEIKRIPVADEHQEEMFKRAHLDEWVSLDHDPEPENNEA